MKRLIAALLFTRALVRVAARRLWAHRRLAAGLLVGFAIAVAASASVPVFTVGSLQRVLVAEIAAEKQRHPASVHIAHVEKPARLTGIRQFLAADEIARTTGPRLLGLPVDPFVRFGSTELGRATPVDSGQVNPNRERWMAVAFQSDLEQHITLTDGRLPAPGNRVGDIYEAVVEEAALDKQDFTVGARLKVPLGRAEKAPVVEVQVVGAFRRTQPNDAYWFQANAFEQQFFVSEEAFRTEILTKRGAVPGQYSWYWGIEANDLRVNDAIRFLGAMYDLEARMAQALPDTELFAGPMEMLTRYAYRAQALQLMLLLLAAPLLVVVAYFIVVTSGMIVDSQRLEIAVLRSRGTGLGQVLFIYTLEGVLLSGIGLATGLPLAILLARLMGSAASFLQFVNRTQPPLLLSADFWLYGAAAALLALVAYVAPAIPAAAQSIVAYKQESARGRRMAGWARFGADALCLGLAAYSYYMLRTRHGGALALAVGDPVAGAADPLALLAPALFITGAGLLLIRVLPLLGRALAGLAERWAGAPLYLALTHLGRAPAGYIPAVFLLTLTTGIGLYSAAAARTVEGNSVDRVRYAAGADVVLNEVWEFQDADPANPGTGAGAYIPPPWELHYQLPGVEHPARVRVQEVAPSIGGKSQRKGTLMAIDPPDFGRVAWFRRDLLPVHINAYLNQLAADEEAVLVSSDFLRRNKLRPGDRIGLAEPGGREVSLVIYGGVDYWPTLYPQDGDFFVANLDFVESNLGLQPYQVWLKMLPEAKLQPVIDALKIQSVLTVSASDTRQAVIRTRRDPYVGGMMGGLTAGFLLAAALTVLGFWLHAALSARARLLQFGLVRAVGLFGPQLSLWVMLEQVLTAAAGVAGGTGLGLLAARLFVPFLQQGGDAAAQTPPFLVVSAVADRVRLYAVLLVMLLVSVAGLAVYLGRLRIHEAVKLGEDH